MYLALGEGLDVGSAAVGLLVLAGYALPQERVSSTSDSDETASSST